ncbi:hypothetical protein MPSEU_000900100 [Mayamaea pseudoterrestris]|nr:hypothetical protein MPSEU_000900100 [Mayamaea pseudoterrestris]
MTYDATSSLDANFEEDPFDDDDDDDDDDPADCLRELLGGVSFVGLSEEAWGCQEEAVTDVKLTASRVHRIAHPGSLMVVDKPTIHKITSSSAALESLSIFENSSCSMSPNTTNLSPPVQIIAMPNRGNGLIATTNIRRGAVIYTERAFLAAQHDAVSVRACQHCFRSLEPISKLKVANAVSSDDRQLPLPSLWAIPDIIYTHEQPQACSEAYKTLLGSCCASVSIADALQIADPVILLVIRLFAYTLQLYRATNSLEGSMLQGLCGDANDVIALEIGDFDPLSSTYSLHTLHASLVNAYTMVPSEVAVLSLDHLHKHASMAARNGVGLVTQSPFKTYYSDLLRSTGGRGSAQHDAVKTQVAYALGSADGVLQRGMDRLVDDKVAPHISALFLLTARINHECISPNACIQSQVFCDAHMDLVATRDIQRGEELTISYISTGHGVGRKSTNQRRRELVSKYLFFCECAACRLRIEMSNTN